MAATTTAMRSDSISHPFTAYGHDTAGGFVASGDARLGVMAFMPQGWGPGVAVQGSDGRPPGRQAAGVVPGVSAGIVVALAQEIDRFGYTVNAGLRMGLNRPARDLKTGSSPIGGVELHYLLPVLDDTIAVGAELLSKARPSTARRTWRTDKGTTSRWWICDGRFRQVLGKGVGASQWRSYVGWQVAFRRSRSPSAHRLLFPSSSSASRRPRRMARWLNSSTTELSYESRCSSERRRQRSCQPRSQCSGGHSGAQRQPRDRAPARGGAHQFARQPPL